MSEKMYLKGVNMKIKCVGLDFTKEAIQFAKNDNVTIKKKNNSGGFKINRGINRRPYKKDQ